MQTELAISILKFMIYQAVKNGRVGQVVHLSEHKKWLGCPNATFHRAINKLMMNGMIQRVGRDRYTLGLWAIDLVESWGTV